MQSSYCYRSYSSGKYNSKHCTRDKGRVSMYGRELSVLYNRIQALAASVVIALAPVGLIIIVLVFVTIVIADHRLSLPSAAALLAFIMAT